MSTKIKIVYENQDYLIIDKPALLDSQNSKEGRESVVDFLEDKFKYAGLIHRLDFGTSGLMVCAKNAVIAKKLTDDLQAGKIKRTYQALVMGIGLPDSGVIEFLVEEKPARTHFKVLKKFPNASLVEATLETGRKHQIRSHFSELGFPVIGDHRYKKKGSDRLLDRPALHACEIIVEGKKYFSELPVDISALIKRLDKKSN